MTRPQAVLFPFPFSGHINPTLKLARLLHSRGFFVSFVNTEFNHEMWLSTGGPDSVGSTDGFRLEAIPDGLSRSDRGMPDYAIRLCRSMRSSCAAPLKELVLRLNRGGHGVPPVTCIVLSGLMSFALGVAEELRVRCLVLWGTSACGFMGTIRLGELRRRGYTPLKDESYLTNGYLDTPIDWIAGMPSIRLGDISSFVRTVDPDNFELIFDEEEGNNCSNAHGLILNTFDDLESDVLNALKEEFPRVYTIGPLAAMHHRAQRVHDSSGLSLWEEDAGCTEWLDTQCACSVLYVSFGSLTVLTHQQLAEFAWGLAESSRPFLWIIRPGLVMGDHGIDALPQDFVAHTKDRCFLATWCAQEQVLHHPAIGGFLTHSGWNSTSESIWAGVPMICWPGFADQYMNCRYVCEEWGIGLRLDEKVRREQVKDFVEELMQGERGQEMRKNSMTWKRKVEQAIAPGGSSYENFERLVDELSSEKLDENVVL